MNVIALISGGKDSFFSLLHCIANGHKVVALANLHPSIEPPKENDSLASRTQQDPDHEEELDSYMYQTVGHTVIPCYQEALRIPLYRQTITGSALNVDKSYQPRTRSLAGDEDSEEDETESLVPLLQRILFEHPEANALSSGAILSDYQRTRVESVALRLGLTPLAYLWHYTSLPPGTQTALLDDMHAVGMDARILKIASGGLDDSFLWEDVTDPRVQQRLIKAMGRFGGAEGGAILGEGGEFETIVLSGPEEIWKKEIVIDEASRSVVRMSGGVAIISINEARAHETLSSSSISSQDAPSRTTNNLRIPPLLDPLFDSTLAHLEEFEDWSRYEEYIKDSKRLPWEESENCFPWTEFATKLVLGNQPTLVQANLSCTLPAASVAEQMDTVVKDLQTWLGMTDLTPESILFTTLILRSMSTFPEVNTSYGKLFTKPDPPARVTIACGDLLPPGVHVLMSIILDTDCIQRRGLHVQSRSYWAPSNIGPYSQAISTPLIPAKISSYPSISSSRLVYIAGQIPLEPATMNIASRANTTGDLAEFAFHTVLALQHLWRVGSCEMVKSWLGCIAFLAGEENMHRKACLASKAWEHVHQARQEDKPEEEVDLWEEKLGRSRKLHSNRASSLQDHGDSEDSSFPPFFAIQVDGLPRGSNIEWSCAGVDQKDPLIWDVHSKGDLQVTSTSLGQSDISIFYSSVSSNTGSADAMFLKMQELIKYGESLMPRPDQPHRVWSYVTVYIAQPVDLVRLIKITRAQIIPCRSAWDANGDPIAAALVQRVQVHVFPFGKDSSSAFGGAGWT